MVARLGRAAPAVVELRLRSVLEACLECRHPDVGGEVLTVLDARKLRPSQARLLIELWKRELSQPEGIRAVIWGVNCLVHPELPARRREQIIGAIREYRDTLSREHHDKWYREVRRCLDPTRHETWAEVAGQDA